MKFVNSRKLKLAFSKSLSVLIFGAVLFPSTLLETRAEVKLATIFSDHMVLQRGMEIPVWGWADRGEKITLSLNGQTVSVKPDKRGKWIARFAPMDAGGPYEMSIQGENKIILTDILIGDIWLCGGQSNMEMPVKGWPGQPVLNSEREIRYADYPNIRILHVERKISIQPVENIECSGWESAIGRNIADFSAVGYFFGKEVHLDQDVPIGLISVNWGGTVCETWISNRALKSGSDFSEIVVDMEKSGKSIEDYMHENEEAVTRWIQQVEGNDEGLKKGWMNLKAIPDKWKGMKLPGKWESEMTYDFDGIIWFIKEVNIPEHLAGKDLTLFAGYIDDSDQTWFNGVKIGGLENRWDQLREYTIPGEYVKKGKNMITIRVLDTGGGGGIYGDPKELVLNTSAGDDVIPLSGEWKYQVGYEFIKNPPSAGFGPNSKPTLLFNGMLHPLIPFGIKGAIWYQGESNDSRAYQYRRLFPLMIRDWRKHWNQGDFPFLFVQLAAHHPVDENPVESSWAELREAQLMTLSLPNTGMAVTIDIGEADNIHPANKEEVGRRLALAAKKIAYHQDVVYSGPVYQSMEVAGNEVKITFSHTGSGLVAKDKYGYLRGFTIAGEDRTFHWAKARLEGDTVFVYHPSIQNPVAVRYAWSDNPDDTNLYNKEGLPASPFRTDNWPGITEGVK